MLINESGIPGVTHSTYRGRGVYLALGRGKKKKAVGDLSRTNQCLHELRGASSRRRNSRNRTLKQEKMRRLWQQKITRFHRKGEILKADSKREGIRSLRESKGGRRSVPQCFFLLAIGLKTTTEGKIRRTRTKKCGERSTNEKKNFMKRKAT